MGVHCEKGDLTIAQIERKTPVPRPALQLKQSSLCGLHCSGDQGGGETNGRIVSVKTKRADDGRRQKSQKIIDEEREKYRTNESLRNTSTDLKKTTLVILINLASAPITKERSSPTSKARREASRNKFFEKGGMPESQKL